MCISGMERVLKSGKYACIVIENKIISRVKMPTDEFIV